MGPSTALTFSRCPGCLHDLRLHKMMTVISNFALRNERVTRGIRTS